MRSCVGSALFAIVAIFVLITAIAYQAEADMSKSSLYQAIRPLLHRSSAVSRSIPLVSALNAKLNSVLPPNQWLQQSSTTPKSFSSTAMASEKSFLEAVKSRRSYYALNKNPPISDDKIVELVNDAVLHVPSSFNSQSTRLVVLLKDEHDKFWDFVIEVLKPMLPDEEQLKSSTNRINGFRAAYGTILFFEDPHPVQELQTKLPLYADKFPVWSEHTGAMHQYMLWTALEAEGLGANLQHYNPLVDQRAKREWAVPMEWQLHAQLVFGGRSGEPAEKTHKPLSERVFVHGK
ncbi:MAG: hypothetical protein M1822_006122 [Bathelium mastoideum]|nr:MAG: hypothetical protein M1822_006122 [Bathelium mastoideum]